ncbi:M20/M25/M40 family metallo-hydrolase [Lachnospiraceae bacterium 62-35]
MEKVFAYIEGHKQEYLDELFEFLRCKSISTTNEGMEECAELLAGMMKKSGIQNVKIYPTNRHPVVYGEIITDPSLPVQLVYGHYDVQPADMSEGWDSPPFEPVIRGDKIFCRGCSDNKAQLFAYLKGVEAYLAVHGSLPVNIKYMFEGEEEIGSENLGAFMEEHAEMLQCDAIIYSDGHRHESGRPILLLGHKGMVSLEMSITGAERDTHSMRAPSIPNPIWRMVGLLNTLKGEDGFVKIDGFYDNVRNPNELEIETAKKIPCDDEEIKRDYGLKELVHNRTDNGYYYNIVFEPTCNIAGIYGGYTGQGSKTVLPNKATVKIDMRLVPNQEPEEIKEKFVEHLRKRGYEDAEITFFHSSAPARTPIDDPYVKVACQAVEDGFGETPILSPSVGGGGPHYLFDRILKVPAIEIPLARADQNNHAPNESMGLDGIFCGIKMAAALIDRLAAVKK